METKLTAIGNSTGVRIPSELLHSAGLTKGDKVYITPMQGGFMISAYDPDFAEDIKNTREIMNNYKNALHELAK